MPIPGRRFLVFGSASFECVVLSCGSKLRLRSNMGSTGLLTLRTRGFCPISFRFSFPPYFRMTPVPSCLYSRMAPMFSCLYGLPEPCASSAYPLLNTASHCFLAVGIPCLARASSSFLVQLSIAVRAPRMANGRGEVSLADWWSNGGGDVKSMLALLKLACARNIREPRSRPRPSFFAAMRISRHVAFLQCVYLRRQGSIHLYNYMSYKLQ